MTTDKHQRTIDAMIGSIYRMCRDMPLELMRHESIVQHWNHREKWPECSTEGAGERGKYGKA